MANLTPKSVRALIMDFERQAIENLNKQQARVRLALQQHREKQQQLEQKGRERRGADGRGNEIEAESVEQDMEVEHEADPGKPATTGKVEEGVKVSDVGASMHGGEQGTTAGQDQDREFEI